MPGTVLQKHPFYSLKAPVLACKPTAFASQKHGSCTLPDYGLERCIESQ